MVKIEYIKELIHVFRDAGSDRDVSCAAQYVTDQFVACATTSGKMVYSHFTNATDPSSVRDAFQLTMSTIVEHNLQTVSLL